MPGNISMVKAPSRGPAPGIILPVPMDNNQYCKCPACQAQMNADQKDSKHFTAGYATDYVFGFVNKVARELRKTHPNKFLSAIAYHDYAYYPEKISVEPNVSVQMCLHVRNWWAPGMEQNDMLVYNSWTTREKGRPLYLWLYHCFPELLARQWHCFPGCQAHLTARQIRMFAHDGIRGRTWTASASTPTPMSRSASTTIHR